MKNMILSALVILSVAMLSVVAKAGNRKVLLVSDIDDTIKVSHVLSTAGKVTRSVNFTVPFTGMSQLYQLIINQNINSTHTAYISNAPKLIAGEPVMRISHEAFLSYNHFPKGDLLLRDSLLEKNHKIKTIRQLVESMKPELVILIGDNGERDIEIYDQATKELSHLGIQTQTYIHQLYSSKSLIHDVSQALLPDLITNNLPIELGQMILPGQVGFVTPIEIALDLKNKNLLDQFSLDWMINKIAPVILNEDYFDIDTLGSVTFPSFKNCTDFKWTSNIPYGLNKFSEKMNKKCR